MSDFTERNLAMLLQRAYVEVSDERIEAALARFRARQAPRRPAAFSLPALAAAAMLAVAALWISGRGPQATVPVASPSSPQETAPSAEDPELAALTKEIEKNPESSEAWRKRAERYLFLDRHKEALADVERAIKLKPDSVEALLTRSEVPIGNRKAAVERAMALRPDWAPAFLAYARLYGDPVFMGRFSKEPGEVRHPVSDLKTALVHCETALRLDPKDADAHVFHAAVLLSRLQLNNPVQAERDLARALELRPRHPEALLLRARMTVLGLPATADHRPDPVVDVLEAALGGADVEPVLLERLGTAEVARLEAQRSRLRPGVVSWLHERKTLAEISRWIDRLALDEEAARREAEEKLLALGAPAAAQLRRAKYHENPDVRVRSQEAADRIEKQLSQRARIDHVLKAVASVRDLWKRRAFDDFESEVVEIFQLTVSCVYVPKRTIGEQVRLDPPHSLTKEVVEALDAGPGILFFRGSRVGERGFRWDRFPYSSTAIFTLPDAKGWSAYVVVQNLPME